MFQRGQQAVPCLRGIAGIYGLQREQQRQVGLVFQVASRLKGDGQRERALDLEKLLLELICQVDNRAQRGHGDDHRDRRADRPPANAARLTAFPLGDRARFLTLRQVHALVLFQVVGMFGGPLLRLEQRGIAQEHPVGTPGLLPQRGLLLHRAQMRGAPGRVVGAHRSDQPIMGQLEPGGAAPPLGAHQVRIHQRPDRPVIQPRAGIRAEQHLTTDAAGVISCRSTHSRMVRSRTPVASRDGRHLLGIIASQRGLHVADRADVGFADRRGVVGQTLPQPPAHDLKLHRLDVRAESRRGRAVGPLHVHRAQIIHQPARRRVREIHARFSGGSWIAASAASSPNSSSRKVVASRVGR